ncbi:AraC family transcriptional regulator [Mycobacterium hodleri]|uniref:AraC family transcriptional regulator n=1 Tax=Mycolicibacterium hodleri TaxID=49897 RepID=A0A544W0A5_9MYCO|nr:AraC family transcriptional regulator [Mycolicibacterium hodleri]TQR85677.1 AraC family transcriptional regulator [Mycolicibacterium hodleri]
MNSTCRFRSATDDLPRPRPPMRLITSRNDDEHHRRLSEHLCTHAHADGANVGPWPGSMIYRFTRPGQPRWDDIGALSVGIIVSAATTRITVGRWLLGSRTNYVVLGGPEQFDCRILEASPDQPVLCLALAIDPQLVRSLWTNMRGLGVAVGHPGDGAARPVSTLDDELTITVLRFLESLSDTCDRRVLAPLQLQELVYRMLQREQRGRLIHLAARELNGNSIAAVLDYIRDHLADPLAVDALAAQVCLSPSAFSRLFRERTGRPPYRYVKEVRLDRARQLFDEGRCGVAETARSVGYTSVSHFIKEFRIRFGSTPGDYADAHLFGSTVRALPVAAG